MRIEIHDQGLGLANNYGKQSLEYLVVSVYSARETQIIVVDFSENRGFFNYPVFFKKSRDSNIETLDIKDS